MVIDMNEAQVRTLDQVRQVLAGTQAMAFHAGADDEGRYAWIELVLRRFEYRRLPRADRGPVLAYLQRLSGYSRALASPGFVEGGTSRRRASLSSRINCCSRNADGSKPNRK